MKSNIVSKLNPKFKPVVIIKTDTEPENITGPKTRIGGCSMAYLAKTITERIPTYFSKYNATCAGIATGLGWADEMNDFSIDYQACFLSKGLKSAKNKVEYEKLLESKSDRVKEMFLKGERFYDNYETAYENIKKRPVINNGDYAIFKALEHVKDEKPDSVIFIADGYELQQLIQLDGSHRSEISSVLTPQASACQSIGCHVFSQKENSKPVLGFIDPAARRYLKGIPKEYLSLSMRWDLFMKLGELSYDSLFNIKE